MVESRYAVSLNPNSFFTFSLFTFRFVIIFCIFNLFNVSLQDSMEKRACYSSQWILTVTKCVYGIYFNVKSTLVSLIVSSRHRWLCVCVCSLLFFSVFFFYFSVYSTYDVPQSVQRQEKYMRVFSKTFRKRKKNQVQIVFDINFRIRLWFLESM